MLIFAIEQKDIPVVQAGILTITAVYALANPRGRPRVRLLQPAHPLRQCGGPLVSSPAAAYSR
jgi:hypothetical protein